MKLKFFAFVAIIFATFHAHAQLPTPEAVKDTFAGIKKEFSAFIENKFDFSCKTDKKSTNKKFISTPAFTKLSEKYFAFAITDKDKTPIGSFASLDFSNNDTKLNLSVTSDLRPRSYLTISTSLSVKDKSGSIFSNNKINSGFSGTLKYSIRSNNSTVYYYQKNCESLERSVEYKKAASLESIEKDYLKTLAALHRIKEINFLTRSCNVESVHALDVTTIKKCSELLDEKAKLEQTITEFNKKKIKTAAKGYEDSLVSFEVENALINGISFHWWSFTGSYGSESYDLYDVTRKTPDAAIFTKRHNRFKLGIEYAWFKNLTETYTGKAYFGRSKMFSLGAYWEHDNNIKDLKALKTPFVLITENNDTVTSSSASEKNVVYNASTIPYTKYGSMKFNIKYLTYYSKKRIWGIDLFADATANEVLSGPLINAGAGIVFNIKNADDAKPKVSFEIFYKLVDITERLSTSTGAVIERNEIGITAAIPFQKFIL